VQALAELDLPLLGQQVGDEELVDDEEQDDQPAGHQDLTGGAGDGAPALAGRRGCRGWRRRQPVQGLGVGHVRVRPWSGM
jgi:hypothetical protein